MNLREPAIEYEMKDVDNKYIYIQFEVQLLEVACFYTAVKLRKCKIKRLHYSIHFLKTLNLQCRFTPGG